MRYRRDTWRDRASQHIQRGLYGLGVMVVGLSVTQGIAGIIGIILLILLISAFTAAVLWIARTIEGLVARRGVE